MDFNWSPDDSLNFVQSEDDSEAEQISDAQDTSDNVRPSRRKAPLNIDDLDFEALIEILGTDSDQRNADFGRREMQNESVNNRRPGQSERTAQPVARETRGTNEASAHTPGRSAPRSPPRNPTMAARETSTTKAGRANHNPAPSGSRVNRPAPQSTPAQEMPFQLPSPRRTSSPIPSQRKRQAPAAHRPSPRMDHGFTQSKAELGTSIVDVKDQVEDLRDRLQVLKSEIREFAPHLYRRAFDVADLEVQRAGSDEEEQAAQRRQHSAAKGKGKAVERPALPNGQIQQPAIEAISSLTEDEAKRILITICQTLGISPLSLPSSSTHSRPDSLPVSPSDLSDIVRALNLVSCLDDLVWHRRNFEAGPSRTHPGYNIYDGENIGALLDRVRLWERTARSRHGCRDR